MFHSVVVVVLDERQFQVFHDIGQLERRPELQVHVVLDDREVQHQKRLAIYALDK